MSTKNVMATTKLTIFDASFSAIDTRSDGYENPKNAHTANTKNNPPKENSVYFDSFVKGDRVRNENVEISTRNRGRKKSNLKRFGAGGIAG